MKCLAHSKQSVNTIVNYVRDDGDFDCGNGDGWKCPNWRDISVMDIIKTVTECKG